MQLSPPSSKIEYHKVAGSKCRNGCCNSEIAASSHGWPREVCGLQILWLLSGGASPSPSTKQVQCAPKNFLLLQHKLDKVAHTHRHFSRHVAQLQASPLPSIPSSVYASAFCRLVASSTLRLFHRPPQRIETSTSTAAAAVSPNKSLHYTTLHSHTHTQLL